MLQHDFFSNKKILVADKSTKTQNDRTWCFWEKQAGVFESIVHHKWQQIDFYSNHFSARFDIVPYEYKMIRGEDFYNFVISKAKQNKNINFIQGNIESIYNGVDKAFVKIDNDQFSADYIFNSIQFNKQDQQTKKDKNTYSLQQHFKGWLIQTKENLFDERIATFMDFRVSQQHGTTFVYVLPISSNKALVEYTLFTKELLPQHAYDEGLKAYINDFLKTTAYEILETEYGVIPMTNLPFAKDEERIINMGTAGGKTKSSSGYTFQFIQKHADAIIASLLKGKHPAVQQSLFAKRFSLYDNTLLNVLWNNKLGGDKVFADMFRKNPVQRVFRFLDNETNPVEELKLVSTVPTKVFLPAAVQELFR